jgi:hypothetical protein
VIEKQMQEEVPMDEEQAPQGDEESNVSPEEQELYDTIVVTAHAYLYSPGATKMVVDKLQKQGQDEGGLPFAIGHTVAMILLSIKGARAKQKMPPVPPETMYAAGQEVLGEVLEIAEKAKLIESAEDPELFKQAAFEAAKAYGDSELKSGEITPEVQEDAKRTLASVRPGKDPRGAQAPEPGLVEKEMGNG